MLLGSLVVGQQPERARMCGYGDKVCGPSYMAPPGFNSCQGPETNHPTTVCTPLHH